MLQLCSAPSSNLPIAMAERKLLMLSCPGALSALLHFLIYKIISKFVIVFKDSINNLSYADDTTLMAESQEELKSLLMKVKVESEKVGLKLTLDEVSLAL